MWPCRSRASRRTHGRGEPHPSLILRARRTAARGCSRSSSSTVVGTPHRLAVHLSRTTALSNIKAADSGPLSPELAAAIRRHQGSQECGCSTRQLVDSGRGPHALAASESRRLRIVVDAGDRRIAPLQRRVRPAHPPKFRSMFLKRCHGTPSRPSAGSHRCCPVPSGSAQIAWQSRKLPLPAPPRADQVRETIHPCGRRSFAVGPKPFIRISVGAAVPTPQFAALRVEPRIPEIKRLLC
jgi:hypothetical protein